MNKKVMAGCIVVLFALLTYAIVISMKTPEPVVYEEDTESEEQLVIGFSQVGAESDWRAANTTSMQETFNADGVTLILDDAQQKQANQITAIRKFIQQEVDYIVLAPVTETGWDTVLTEAKQANIPVIIIDRMVDIENSGLYTCWLGSDFYLEGKKAAEWLHQFCLAKSIDENELHIVDVQGTIGASAQLGRSAGITNAAKEYGWDLAASVEGEFTQAKGYEVTYQILKENRSINVIYCENDNEALGALKAIKDIGKTPGSDIQNGEIMVISFDGVGEEAVQHALNGEISCIVECNPIHGPRVKAIIDALEKKEKVAKMTYVEEEIYSVEDVVRFVTIEDNTYEVTPIGEHSLAE